METAVKYLTEYPKLPVLTMVQCVSIFKAAKFGPSGIAALTGYSRQTATAWIKDPTLRVLPATQTIVSALAYKVLRALTHKHYPLRRFRTIPSTAYDALQDSLYAKPLNETEPQDILPKSWLAAFAVQGLTSSINPPREEDATV